jgi:hypothetical protein
MAILACRSLYKLAAVGLTLLALTGCGSADASPAVTITSAIVLPDHRPPDIPGVLWPAFSRRTDRLRVGYRVDGADGSPWPKLQIGVTDRKGKPRGLREIPARETGAVTLTILADPPSRLTVYATLIYKDGATSDQVSRRVEPR